MTQPRNIPPQDTADALQDILSRAFQCFAYYHYYTRIHPNPGPNSASDLIAIKNSALESSLMSVRDLDDFFASNPRHPDDMVATDYGFPPARQFLTPAERQGINKKLAHLTYQAVREHRHLPAIHTARTWNNADLVNRAMARTLDFFAHLEASIFASSPAHLGFIQTARQAITATLKNMNTIARQEMDFPA